MHQIKESQTKSSESVAEANRLFHESDCLRSLVVFEEYCSEKNINPSVGNYKKWYKETRFVVIGPDKELVILKNARQITQIGTWNKMRTRANGGIEPPWLCKASYFPEERGLKVSLPQITASLERFAKFAAATNLEVTGGRYGFWRANLPEEEKTLTPSISVVSLRMRDWKEHVRKTITSITYEEPPSPNC